MGFGELRAAREKVTRKGREFSFELAVQLKRILPCEDPLQLFLKTLGAPA